MACSSSSSTIYTCLISSSNAFKEASDSKSEPFTALCNFLEQGCSEMPIDVRGNTILHFLAMYGNLPALKKLFGEGLLTQELLMRGNNKGNTALHEAVRFGQEDFVQFLLDKEKDLVKARNDAGETPLFVAAACGKEDVFNILLNDKGHKNDLMTTTDGRTVLHAAIMGEYYSLAMSILDSFSCLALELDENGMTALDLLATKPLSFKSGSSYSLMKLGTKPFIPLQIIAIFIYFCIPSMVYTWKHGGGDVENQHQNEENMENQNQNWVRLNKSKGYLVTRLTSVCPWLREIEDAKQNHSFALALAKRLVGKECIWSRYKKKTLQNQNPLVHAAKNGIIEIVKEILEKFPEAAYSFDNNGKNIMHTAVEQKDRILYDYLKKNVDHNDEMLADVDNDGNNVLHLAANLGTNPGVVVGHLNQMTWDMCWFKRVWFDCPPHFLYIKNSSGETAKDLFETHHSDLREKAEKAFKDMNNGLMLVTVLIGTVNYTALLTIPGGYNQDDGLPVFLTKGDKNKKKYSALLFVWYASIALFSSLVALGTMLSIQLSRFRSNDFYIALPFKYIFAMIALFCSTTFTILACLQVYDLDGVSFTPSLELLYQIFKGGCVLMGLFYMDVLYLNFYYMYFVIRYSFGYKGRQM